MKLLISKYHAKHPVKLITLIHLIVDTDLLTCVIASIATVLIYVHNDRNDVIYNDHAIILSIIYRRLVTSDSSIIQAGRIMASLKHVMKFFH